MKFSEMKIKNTAAPPLSSKFQNGLIKIAGRNKYGQPNVRLVWGQSIRRFAYGKERMTYLHAVATLEHKKADYETGLIICEHELYDIGIPLWFIEEWWPPEIACAGWDANRWDWEAFTKIDALGPPPIRGMYCQMLRVEGAPDPFGIEPYTYRAPDAETLEWVKELVWRREQAKRTHSAEEMAPAEEVAKKVRAAYQEYAEAEIKQATMIKDRIKSSLAPHIHRLMTNKPDAAGGGNRSFANHPVATGNKKAGKDKPLNFTNYDMANSGGSKVPKETPKDPTKPLIVVP